MTDENKDNEVKEKTELPSCCKPNNGEKKKGMKGLLYGVIPHIGCIIFVIASILGSTVLIQFFKPLLMNRNIFYYMIGISFGFATLSSLLYLRKNKLLSWQGIKRKKGYLTIMYGTTIGISLLFFFFIFPLTANIGGVNAQVVKTDSLLKISVDIPCPGHATLITNELKTIDGVEGVKFSMPNNFAVYYDASRTSKQEMLSLDVFKEYPAKVIEESLASGYDSQQQENLVQQDTQINTLSSNVNGNVQEVNMNVDYGYNPNSFAIKKGVPVKWNINVKQLTGCNQILKMDEYGIYQQLKQGLNVIEFTPNKIGTVQFSCSMGMLRGSFIVTETGIATQQQLAAATPKGASCSMGANGGGCGCGG